MAGLAKQIARKVMFPLALGLGLDKILRINTTQKRMVIMYHGVTNNDFSYLNVRHMLASQFEQHLKYLKNNYRVISLTQLFEEYQQGVIPNQHTIAITFDDGFINNLEVALPLLEKYQLPATIFIATCCIEEKDAILWADIIELIRANTSESQIEINGEAFQKMGAYGLNRVADGLSVYNYIKNLTVHERDTVLADLALKYNLGKIQTQTPKEGWCLMNPEQIKRLAKSSLIEIGSHTHKHYNLANITIEQAKEELVHSKQLLEDCIGKKINMIAYPDGSYNKAVKKLSQDLGYTYQLAVDYRENDDIQDKSILPRLGLSNSTTFESNMLRLARMFKVVGF